MDTRIAESNLLNQQKACFYIENQSYAQMNLTTPEPIFRSVHDALVFAYNFSTLQYPETSMGRLMRKKAEENGENTSLGTGKGLSGVDGAGQAGIILGAVQRLEFRQMLVIEARFMNRTKPCNSCGHDSFTDMYRLSIGSLAEIMLSDAVVPAGADIRLRRELVYGNFGKRAHNIKLSKKYHLDRHTIGVYQMAITKTLKALEFKAQESLHQRFSASGMLGG